MVVKTVKKKRTKLSEPQSEIIRYLGRGHHIYLDERGKWRMTAKELPDGTFDSAKSGHTNAWYSSGGGGSHLQRPTVEFLAKEGVLKGYFNTENLPCYELNVDCKTYADDIKMARVEGALGVTRKSGKN